VHRGRPHPQHLDASAGDGIAVAQLVHARGRPAGCARKAGGSTQRALGRGGSADDGPSGPSDSERAFGGSFTARRRATPHLRLGPADEGFAWTGRFIYRERQVGHMSDGRAYPRPYLRPPARPNRAAEAEPRRSNAAVPVAIVALVLGLYLGQYSFLAPALLGFVLLLAGGSFLSTRLNPLSPHFYLTRKPSWLAVGVVFLGALFLLWDAYRLFVGGYGPLLNHL